MVIHLALHICQLFRETLWALIFLSITIFYVNFTFSYLEWHLFEHRLELTFKYKINIHWSDLILKRVSIYCVIFKGHTSVFVTIYKYASNISRQILGQKIIFFWKYKKNPSTWLISHLTSFTLVYLYVFSNTQNLNSLNSQQHCQGLMHMFFCDKKCT